MFTALSQSGRANEFFFEAVQGECNFLLVSLILVIACLLLSKLETGAKSCFIIFLPFARERKLLVGLLLNGVQKLFSSYPNVP